MTEMIWLKDSYAKEFDATVEKVDGDGKYIVLNRTGFYPESGGQLSDEGKFVRESDGKEFKVVYAKKFGDNVSHEVDDVGLKVGDKVKGIVDWERRYKMMRMHTTAHLLSALIFKETQSQITGGQLGLEKSRIDFNIENYDREILFGLQKKANEMIAEKVPVEIKFYERSQVQGNAEIMKLLKGIPESVKEIRVIEIGDFDKGACAGCHIQNLSEIGEIEITKAENKGKNNRRIYFTLK